MTHRRDWIRAVVGGGAALASGAFDVAAQQVPGTAGRRTARRPVTPDPTRNALRPVVETWESRLPDDPRAAASLEAVRARHNLPGMVGAILKGPAVVATAATGVRKVGENDPIRATDVIHLGSCTKAMTATLIGTLYEEGLLSPDSTLGQVFSEYANRLHPDFQGVTVSQLLTHRAGLPRNADWWNVPGRNPTEKRYSALLDFCSIAPETRPGTTYTYSNSGYVLAGLMAEHVTGATWEDLTRAKIFEPLNMYSAGFGPPGLGRGSVGEQPYGHHVVDGRVQPIRHDNPEVMGPAGTVHCTILDWAKFALAHLRGEREGAKILRPATYRGLHTPPRGAAYAGGWMVAERPWAGGLTLSHSGSNTMWFATVWLAPARDFGMLVATNQGGGATDQACDEAVGSLLRLYQSAYAVG